MKQTEGSLPKKTIQGFRDAFAADRAARIASNASVKSGLLEAATDAEALGRLPHAFSLRLKQGSITYQKSSGRCWLFSGLNTLRYEMIHRFDLEDFELSQNYLFFYDKLERSNYFLENMILLAKEPLEGRLMQFLLRSPVEDGGQWDMFANLVRKYGVVPKKAYPDGANSIKSGPFNRYLAAFLRECAATLRRQAAAGKTVEELRALKEDMMRDVYRIIVIALGEPPKTFDFTMTSKDGKVYQDFNLTPRNFYDRYIGVDLDAYVSLINAPTEDKPYHKMYTVKYLGNVAEGAPVTYLNLPMETIRDAAVAQLQDGHPVWFGSDCMEYALRDEAVFDRASTNVEQLLGISYQFSKGDRLNYGESAMDHAMVFLGVNLDSNGKPDRWLIENSWGKDSGPNGGYYTASEDWFENFVYQVVVNRQYLKSETVKLLHQDSIPLEPWDPMGTLA